MDWEVREISTDPGSGSPFVPSFLVKYKRFKGNFGFPTDAGTLMSHRDVRPEASRRVGARSERSGPGRGDEVPSGQCEYVDPGPREYPAAESLE